VWTWRASSGKRGVVPLRPAYSYDLNSRETLETRLGVFASFQPRIPDKFRDAKFVFLGTSTRAAAHVLDQVKQRSSSPATP